MPLNVFMYSRVEIMNGLLIEEIKDSYECGYVVATIVTRIMF